MSGCLILSSYLVLFILFYIATYKKAAGKKRDKVQPDPREVLKDANGAMPGRHCGN